jgi:hypothetical protein
MAKKMKKLRGTIRPLVRPFPPVGKMHWRKQKTLTMLQNRRQWQREFEPTQTPGIEIEMEHLTGYYLITEASTTDPDITWITTE